MSKIKLAFVGALVAVFGMGIANAALASDDSGATSSDSTYAPTRTSTAPQYAQLTVTQTRTDSSYEGTFGDSVISVQGKAGGPELGPATDAECQRFASNINSWLDSASETLDNGDINAAIHEVEVAAQIGSYAEDQGCILIF